MRRTRPNRVATVLAALALATLPNLTAAAGPPRLGAATPDELVSRLRAASTAADPIELAALMSPRARAEMSLGMTIAGAMMVAMQGFGLEMASGMGEALDELTDDAGRAEAEASTAAAKAQLEATSARFEAILERHGLPNMMDESSEAGSPEQAMAAFEDVDHLAYLADVFGFLKESFPDQGEPPTAGKFAGEIGAPTVDGDHGTIAVGEESFDLIRVDGRWYLDPPSEMGATEQAPEE